MAGPSEPIPVEDDLDSAQSGGKGPAEAGQEAAKSHPETSGPEAPAEDSADASDISRQIAEAFAFFPESDSEETVPTSIASPDDDAKDATAEEPPLKRARTEADSDGLAVQPEGQPIEASSLQPPTEGIRPTGSKLACCRPSRIARVVVGEASQVWETQAFIADVLLKTALLLVVVLPYAGAA